MSLLYETMEETNKRWQECLALDECNARTSKTRAEYNKFADFLSKNGQINERISPEIVGKFLMFRTIKDGNGYIAYDTFKSIKARLARILNELGYRGFAI